MSVLVDTGVWSLALRRRHVSQESAVLELSELIREDWARLDEFEGEGYERVLTTVKLKDGTAVDAYIYRLSGNGPPLSPTGGS